jgi:hypothetical protein
MAGAVMAKTIGLEYYNRTEGTLATMFGRAVAGKLCAINRAREGNLREALQDFHGEGYSHPDYPAGGFMCRPTVATLRSSRKS